MRPHIFRGPLRAFQYVIMRVFLDVFSPLSGVVFLRSVFVILRRDFKCEFGHLVTPRVHRKKRHEWMAMLECPLGH